MQLTRRYFALSVAALGLSGCSSATPTSPVRNRASGLPADLRPVPNSAYDAWVRGFFVRAKAKGISDATLRSGFRDTGYLPGVVKRDRNQTEFKRSLEDYLSIAASDERISKGRAAYAQQRTTLNALEAKLLRLFGALKVSLENGAGTCLLCRRHRHSPLMDVADRSLKSSSLRPLRFCKMAISVWPR